MTGGYSYVSNVGVAHRAAIAGDKGARAGIRQMPERTGKKMAPCPARRALTSSPRARRAASYSRSAAAVTGPTRAGAIWGPTPPKSTREKKCPNGTAGR